MSYQNHYVIDFSKVTYHAQMHEVIRIALDFPDYYGNNWDAFWDSLRDMIGQSMRIQIRRFDVIQKRFPEEAKVFIEILKEFKHYRNDSYCDEIVIEMEEDGKTIYVM